MIHRPETMSIGAAGCMLAAVNYLDLVTLVAPQGVAVDEAAVFVVAYCSVLLISTVS